jgi:putative membrane protein
MGWMGIWWIVGAALIAVVIWALLRSSRGSMSGSSQSPEQLLKRRYAKGEIEHETYQRMLTELKG